MTADTDTEYVSFRGSRGYMYTTCMQWSAHILYYMYQYRYLLMKFATLARLQIYLHWLAMESILIGSEAVDAMAGIHSFLR